MHATAHHVCTRRLQTRTWGGTAAVQSSNSTQLVRKELCLSRERFSESCYFISGSTEAYEEEEEIPGCWRDVLKLLIRGSPLTHSEFEHSDQVCIICSLR